MKPPPDPDMENRLRSLTWKPVPPAALQGSLQSALEAWTAPSEPALPPVLGTFPSCLHGVIGVVPRSVRWTLAACWMLSLGFWLATPHSVSTSPSLPTASLAALPPLQNPWQYLTMQQSRQQIDELDLLPSR